MTICYYCKNLSIRCFEPEYHRHASHSTKEISKEFCTQVRLVYLQEKIVCKTVYINFKKGISLMPRI